MSKVLPVTITTDRDGDQWAALGNTDLAKAVAIGLRSTFGGTSEFAADGVRYYNAACTVPGDDDHSLALYQDMVDQVIG